MPRFHTPEGPVEMEISRLVVAGWTGRDRDKVEHHIAELAEIGVPRPSQVPLFYEVSPALATQADEVRVLGVETSGEAEPLVVHAGGRLWLGIASDHTDRGLEAHSVAHSKQVCAKIMGRDLWPFDAVADRLDGIRLRCEIDGGTPYQDGTLADIVPLATLIEGAGFGENTVMLCGTLPAIGGVRPAGHYRMTLDDAELGVLELAYSVKTLPVVR